MKSKDEIRKLAEKEIPYNPYDETLFPGFRTAKIEGFIKGYNICQLQNMEQVFLAGKSGNYESFEDFIQTNQL